MDPMEWWTYRRRSLRLTPAEGAVASGLAGWVPRRVIDVHTHCTRPEDVGVLPPAYRRLPLATFPHYTLDDAQYSRILFWPDHEVTSLRFSSPISGIDHRAANRYLLENAPGRGDEFVGFGIPDDPSYTRALLDHPATRALKMYHRYYDPPATTLAEFLPDEILTKAARVNIPLILHLPRPPAAVIDELMRMLAAHPALRIVLAHIGTARPGSAEDLAALREAATLQNVYCDTALVINSELVEQALLIFGPERVLYGSDEPLSLISAAEYEHPDKGKQWVSFVPYHWLDQTDARVHREHAGSEMLLHFAQLVAIRDATTRAFTGALRARALAEIFHAGAVRLFGAARRAPEAGTDPRAR